MDGPRDLSSSPVLALEFNILWQFENLSADAPTQLRRLVDDGQLAGEVFLDMAAGKPRGPSVRSPSADERAAGAVAPVIHLQTAYLELLWAFIYGWMVLYEEGVQRKMLDAEYQPCVELLKRAELLLTWCGAQRRAYTPWPQNLPSPVSYANGTEQSYGEKANGVFQKAVTFLLNHEKAHAVFGHLEIVLESSDALKKDLEKEADVAAIEEFQLQQLDEQERLHVGWAVLSVVLCTFLLYEEPRQALLPKTHPPVHHRVEHVLRALALKTEKYDHYFKLLAYFVLHREFSTVLTMQEQLEDAEELLQVALDRLDEYALK